MILIPALLLLNLLSLNASQMLLLTLQQQRIIHNYIQAGKVASELELDLYNLRNSQILQYTIITSQGTFFKADDPAPECNTGTNIYQIELTHRTHPTYNLLVILTQRVNRGSGFYASLNIAAVHV
jgi:hypothetical protein